MRLIDADALIEEALTEGAYGYVDALQIANAPTVDAVPVSKLARTVSGLRITMSANGSFVGCLMRLRLCRKTHLHLMTFAATQIERMITRHDSGRSTRTPCLHLKQ